MRAREYDKKVMEVQPADSSNFARALALGSLFLIALGSITLAWVGQLVWHDITVWGKDIALIFFGSRTGEHISLGVGMRVIDYFVMGLAFLLPGLVTLIRRRSEASKLYLLRAQPQKEKEEKEKKEEPPVFFLVKKEHAHALEERIFSGVCLHHFGYLSSRPENTPIPQECILCQRLGDCICARAG